MASKDTVSVCACVLSGAAARMEAQDRYCPKMRWAARSQAISSLPGIWGLVRWAPDGAAQHTVPVNNKYWHSLKKVAYLMGFIAE